FTEGGLHVTTWPIAGVAKNPLNLQTTMSKTKNGVSDGTRVKAIELLNGRLADCIDLQTQTKHAHWNVKGPNFIALHELFDKINEEVEDYVDDIAERDLEAGGAADLNERGRHAAAGPLDQHSLAGANARLD